MGSKYDDDLSNGDSKGNDTSLIVNVNDTQSDMDDHEELNYSETEVKMAPSKKESSSKKSNRNSDSAKKRLVSTSSIESILSTLTPSSYSSALTRKKNPKADQKVRFYRESCALSILWTN